MTKKTGMTSVNVNSLEVFGHLLSQFLDDDDVIRLEKASVSLKYKKGEIILKQGNMPTHIAFLLSGIVKFNYSEDNDKNLILTLSKAPKIIGGANLFYKDLNFFSIVALEECEVILFDKDVVLDILSHNGRFAIAMFQTASEMFKLSILNFISVASKQKESRLADVIVYIANNIYESDRFILPLTRKELSEFACCSMENVISILSRWQKEGIIAINSTKEIQINDMKKLKRIVNVG